MDTCFSRFQENGDNNSSCPKGLLWRQNKVLLIKHLKGYLAHSAHPILLLLSLLFLLHGRKQGAHKEKLVQNALKCGMSKIKDPSSGALGAPKAMQWLYQRLQVLPVIRASSYSSNINTLFCPVHMENESSPVKKKAKKQKELLLNAPFRVLLKLTAGSKDLGEISKSWNRPG